MSTTRPGAETPMGLSRDTCRSCPIVPVMLGDARLASEMADEMLKRGIYVPCASKKSTDCWVWLKQNW